MIQNILCLLINFLFIGCRNYTYEEGVFIKTMPIKTEFFVGEKLDLKGLIVTKFNSSGFYELIENYVTEPENGVELNELGKQEVVICYEGKTLSFDIEVLEVKIIKFMFHPYRNSITILVINLIYKI